MQTLFYCQWFVGNAYQILHACMSATVCLLMRVCVCWVDSVRFVHISFVCSFYQFNALLKGVATQQNTSSLSFVKEIQVFMHVHTSISLYVFAHDNMKNWTMTRGNRKVCIDLLHTSTYIIGFGLRLLVLFDAFARTGWVSHVSSTNVLSSCILTCSCKLAAGATRAIISSSGP